MNRLVRTELLKLRTTRTTVLVVMAGLAFAALLGFANAAIAGDPEAPELGSAAFVEDVLGVSTIPAVVALLLGVLLSAGDTSTAPSRRHSSPHPAGNWSSAPRPSPRRSPASRSPSP